MLQVLSIWWDVGVLGGGVLVFGFAIFLAFFMFGWVVASVNELGGRSRGGTVS